MSANLSPISRIVLGLFLIFSLMVSLGTDIILK
ncbi:hypothetical protein Ga0123462_0974 [Mariprofundus ferrinatatus]|uniref:Uncharacterized protein n=1 Tax=Mariprofundus ferrinatatus TaxID=1921087 RepID=A0A2K8L3L0_9PROT|nr:hypothetical protein Ga0123462_0974 [Mariprofundus ferrinatatus]